jgi:RNA polymerase sigma factor (sigma-70 family)
LQSDRQSPRASADRHGRLIEWFRELRLPLRRFIAGRRGIVPADLDDVAQEVFLRLLRYDREELVADSRGYLFKIAANVASEWSMRARQRFPHESSWLDELTDDRDTSTEMERTQRNRELHRALGELPPREREVLRLHFGEGLNYEMISARLGVTRRIVKRDVVHAYARLRLALTSTAELGVEADMIVAAASGGKP